MPSSVYIGSAVGPTTDTRYEPPTRKSVSDSTTTDPSSGAYQLRRPSASTHWWNAWWGRTLIRRWRRMSKPVIFMWPSSPRRVVRTGRAVHPNGRAVGRSVVRRHPTAADEAGATEAATPSAYRPGERPPTYERPSNP